MQLNELVPVLQLSLAPVIVISGVGLLLLSMTNRYGRVIDRSRVIAHHLRGGGVPRAVPLRAQLAVLSRRARLLRLATTLASFCVLLAAILVITFFVALLANFEATLAIALLFIACMATLIASLLAFIMDINLSLAALELEIAPPEPPKA